ncbi:Superfamily I DNA or RNA helicase [Geodermatophilus sp. DSM 45219]|nr:Superfamily I DNA or RNA helicase [Geodermatophilus sp. DSM 45219]
MTLEPNALTAVTMTERSLVVTAGPGAGKTELLAQRADFLLRTGQCRYPRRILAISFKVDAAKNLKDRVRRRCSPELAARLDSYTFHAFAKRLIDAFRPVLSGIDALDPDYTIGRDRIPGRQVDFDSLAPLATTILESSPFARAALRQTYGFVFLDEFQDCTTNQYMLLHAAFHGTDVGLSAVGDVKQRIMGWAGALEGVLGRFAEDFTAQPLTLYLNFRAQPRLRRMQNAMVRDMEPSAAVPDVDLAGDGGEIEVLRYRDSAEEARELADRIAAWITIDDVPAEEIAILVRAQVGPYTEALRSELRARDVPFREETELQDLSAEPAATLIVDFLAVVTGEREPDAYTRLLDVAIGWRVDDELSERPHAELRRAIDEARREYGEGQHGTLRELVDRFLGLLGEEMLTALAPAYQQGQRLQEVIESVHTRLEQLWSETGDVIQALREFKGRDAVKLLTVHKAKGLEYDVVVVLGVEHEMFWGNDQREEYFVAVSRARKLVCLTVCEQRPRPPDARGRWDVQRRPHREFLDYALSTQ